MVCRGLLFLMKLLLLVPPICAFCWHKEMELWLMSIEKQSWFALLILFTSLLMLIGGLVGSLLNYILPMRRLVSTVEEDSENSLKRQKIDSIHGFTNRDNQIVDEGNVDIDENLHSRQLAVYGRETMQRLLGAKVLISGLQGLGAEVAKNLILAGVKSVTLHDEGLVEMWDLSSNFLFSEHDIGKNRALASVKKLQELSSSVVVFTWTSKISKEQLSNFQAVVFTEIDYERAIEFSEYCHNHNPSIPFIKADIRGLFGSVFCDFGPEFTVFDVKGEEPHTGIVASITNDDPAIVSLIEDERPDFQDGDLVVFTEVEGMTELNDGKPRKIRSSKPYGFVLEEDTRNFGAYEKGGIVTEVLQPNALHFKTLKEALKDPGEFLISDFSKFDRSPLLHLAFQALDKFVSEFGRFPVAASEEDATKLVSFAKINNETSSDRKLDRLDENVLRIFASGSHAVLNPMAAMFGGITGQEVIKACTGKFHPIFQFFYFDSIESLPGCPLRPEDVMPLNCRYDAQISVFGREMQQKLEKAKIFVVGAGALGCEFLKNLALMGASCGNQGKLTITDDDVIEKSNLSRQFLFRDWNIGQAKSTVAATATTEINPCLQIEALQSRVSAATENIFDDTFWENLGVVISALDNIDARLYVDRRCVYFQKPMLESGTLGTKCHTQVIIPHLTENYGASRDPPEKQMPMCTIHYFPHNIEHCLAWARSEFEGLLEKTPSDVNAFLSNPKEFITSIRLRSDTQVRNLLERILECLVFERCSTFEDCVAWSRRKFEDYFSNRVKLLIYQFPKNAKTSENTPFWASPKRFPNPLQFTSSDPAHLSFVAAASILRAQSYGIPIPKWATNSDKLAEVVDKVQVPDFQPEKGVKIVTDESATSINSKDKDGSGDTEDMIQMLEEGVRLLPSRFQMNPILFEKDDDTNYHMDFILGLANMRARNYSIPEVDKLKAKIIAGKIIPAIATTTAIATGLVCLELYKLLSGHSVEKYRNTFANLALPLFSMAEPVPPKKIKHRNLSWTVWDRWIIQQNLTIQEFLGWFEVKGLTVYVISWDDVLVYNALFPKHRERLSKKVIDLVKDTGKWSKHSSRHCIDLEVVCEDEEGNNVDVPGVSVCCN